MRKDNPVLGWVDRERRTRRSLGCTLLEEGLSWYMMRRGGGWGSCCLWHTVDLEVGFPLIIGYLGLVIIPMTKQAWLAPDTALERCVAQFS